MKIFDTELPKNISGIRLTWDCQERLWECTIEPPQAGPKWYGKGRTAKSAVRGAINRDYVFH